MGRMRHPKYGIVLFGDCKDKGRELPPKGSAAERECDKHGKTGLDIRKQRNDYRRVSVPSVAGGVLSKVTGSSLEDDG